MADFTLSLGPLLSQYADGSLEIRRAGGDVLLTPAEVAAIRALPPCRGWPATEPGRISADVVALLARVSHARRQPPAEPEPQLCPVAPAPKSPAGGAEASVALGAFSFFWSLEP